MLRDADPSSFSAIYVVCGYTDMRYGIDTLAAIIETRYHLPLFEVFNEPEFFSDDSDGSEVSEVIVSSHTRKPKTLQDENLKGLLSVSMNTN